MSLFTDFIPIHLITSTSSSFLSLLLLLSSILFIIIIIHFTKNYLTPGASSIPGPLLAKCTHLWRFLDVARGHAQETLYALHRRHGEYVRLGPNVVSVANLEVVRVIYGISNGYVKTPFYKVQQQLSRGKPTATLFTTLDEEFHRRIKKPVAGAYSMSALTEFEPFVDSTIEKLVQRLDEEFVDKGIVCDVAVWVQYYAFDVIGELTFGKPLGFLDERRDVDGIIAALERTLDYAAKIGQIPWLDYLFIKNPLRQLLSGGSTTAVARFARERLNERLSSSKTTSSQRRDFLTRFLEAKQTHPAVVTDAQIFSYTVSNMNAGSDTTAISIRAILYYTLKNPRVQAKLTAELLTAYDAGKLSLPVSWKQSQALPYLDAVIKEALRLHPAVGLLLERIVPEEGLQLPNGGPFLPAGTIVGANPWIVHRHEVFGKDVDAFVPERWLRAEGESEAEFDRRRKEMTGASLTFGMGKRTCIGKNVSLLEMYKLVPSLLLTYEIKLKHPDVDWETVNAWFVRQKKMDVILTRRKNLHNPKV